MQRLIAYLVAAIARAWLFPIYWLSGFVPRSRNLWVFGSWGGNRYADNAAAFFQYCHEHIGDHVTLVWISRRHSVVREVRAAGFQAHWRWSPLGIWSCLRAGVYVFDCFLKDINFWLSRNVAKVNLWSGVPLKVFERSIDSPSSRYYQLFHGHWAVRRLLGILMPWHVVRPNLMIASSDEARRIIARGFDLPESEIPVTGLPRNDALFHPVDAASDAIPDEYAGAIERGDRIYLYLPTIREGGRPFMDIDWEELNRTMLETGAHFFIKLHPAEQGEVAVDLERISKLDKGVEVYDILPHADCLVSDYSSIIWDFMLLEKPIVYYLPDHDKFVNQSRSLNFDVLEIAAGPVCCDFKSLNETLRDPVATERTAVVKSEDYESSAKQLNRYFDDRSSERTLAALENAGIYSRADDAGHGGRLLDAGMSQLLGGSAFIFLCRAGGAALAFATQILLARLMGAAELGVYVWAFSWMILLSTVAGLGLHEAAIRFVGEGLASGSPDLVRGYIRRSGQIVFAMAIVFIVIGIALSDQQLGLVSADARQPLLIVLSVVPAYAMLEFQTSVANGLSWFRLSFLPNNVVRPLLFLGLIGTAGFAGSEVGATRALEMHWIAIVIVFFAVAFLLSRSTRAVLPGTGYQYRTEAWLRTSLPLLVVTTVNAFFPEIMVILISTLLPSADVAVFNASFRTAVLIIFGLHAIDAYMAPQTARLIATGDMSALGVIVNRATRLRFWGALAGTIVLAVSGKWLLGLFGPEFVAGYPVLVILAAAQIIRGGAGPTVRLLSVSGHQKQMLAVFVASLAFAIILVILLVPRYGPTGAALAAAGSIVMWSLWLRSLVTRYLGITPSLRGNVPASGT